MILYLPYVKAFTALLEEKLNYTRRESTNIKSSKLRFIAEISQFLVNKFISKS